MGGEHNKMVRGLMKRLWLQAKFLMVRFILHLSPEAMSWEYTQHIPIRPKSNL